MPLKAIIFDVDGTLAETEEGHRAAFNQAFHETGLDWFWDRARYADLLHVTGGRERMRAFHERQFPGAPAPDFAALHRRKNEIYAEFASDLLLSPGIADLIRTLQAEDITLAIATTTSPENVAALLGKHFGEAWRTIFPVVMAGDAVPRKKPDPAIYLAALEALGCRPQEAVAIEDSPPGVAAARAASIPTIAIPSLYFMEADFSIADHVAADATGVSLHLLRRLAAPDAPGR